MCSTPSRRLSDRIMADEDNFRIRPGRIRSTRAQRARPFVAQALAAANRAGGNIARAGRVAFADRSRFGRGQRASIQANRLVNARTRSVIIKARVVRHTARHAALGTHLSYLGREGVTRDGEKARMFGPGEASDAFAERCGRDRHHFRFIVSPHDALEMADLRSFTHDLVAQMERDLGTRLDWVAVDHWNTEHPHVHLIVRGVRDDGSDLVISRDYIRQGMRDRAGDLITQELGPRSDLDIHQTLARQIKAESWTELDRQLVREGEKSGIVDLAPRAARQPDALLVLKVGRLRSLEIFGVARQVGGSQWFIEPEAETVMRQLGERGDIIKRMHRALSERGIERAMTSYVLAGEALDAPVIGRLLDRGLDDELKGTAYALVDGIDGRAHHIRFADLDATGDSAPGSIVELRAYADAKGQRRIALAVRSDLDLAAQITAQGATWLDRQAIAREPASLSAVGFGAEVNHALQQRAAHLAGQGLAERRGGRILFADRLIETLRRRELDEVGARLAAETGRAFHRSATGESVSGIYRRRLNLASGRFAMLDDGLGFQLVPWTPSLEKQLARHVSGISRPDGGVDWSFGRKRGLGL